MSPVVRTTDARGVATLTLNRPEKHNAFDTQTLLALADELQALDRDSAVRVVILTGAGRTFCAGADLATMRELANATEEENVREAERLTQVLGQLAALSKPTIARVNGNAFGGGVGLIACCDVAIADENAKFTLSEVRLGLVPAAISPHVVAAIGVRNARRYFQTAETISAAEARRIGLVHETAATAALDATVMAIVEELLKGGPQAQREAKELIREVASLDGAPDAKARRALAQRLARLRSSEEGREGMSAFLEKRTPRWRGD